MTDDATTERPKPALPERPTMADFQRYVHDLEAFHGWLDVDLVHNVFLMAEEFGELAGGIRRYERIFTEGEPDARDAAKRNVSHEIVDVLNYLLAIANRLEVDVEAAFREKNARNLERSWS
jgi:NTP pyrophosphatase (non-canonical NTP hydrolase)